MNKEKKAFEPIFEEKLIQAILIDNQFGEQIMDVLDSSYFDLVHTENLSSLLRDYYFEYETFPSVDLIPSLIEDKIKSPVVIKKCNDYLKKIQQNPLNGDLEYVKDKSLEFFRLQNIMRTLANDVLPRIESGVGKLEEIVPIIEKSINKGTENDIGYEYHEDEEERFNEELLETIPTDWPVINSVLKGSGFGKGRLVTFIASPGSGKSTILVNCGKAALLKGKTVVHYTFELDRYEVAAKYDACLTDIEIDNINGNKEQVLFRLKQRLSDSSRLIIKEFPVRGASIQTIKAHLAKLKLKGIIPDLVIIDQGGNLKSLAKNKEDRFNLYDNWLDMKNLAQTYQIPVLTAHQVNRTGYNDDIILPDQIAGCFDLIGVTDILITMARNMSQKQLGIGKMYFAKNRQGKDGQVIAYAINTAKAIIDIFELTEDVESLIEQQKQEQEKSENKDLKRKLQTFLNKDKEKSANV